MTPHTLSASGRRVVRSARTALALVLAAGAAAGCDRVDDLLTVETPSRLAESSLLVPANATLLVASAEGDFQCAYGAYAVASGLAGGELTETSQTASRWNYDRRDVRPTDAHYSTFGCEVIGVYTPLNIARFTNDQILTKLEEWTDAEVPGRQALIARAAAFAGYSLLLLGEGFCSAVVDGGSELTAQQMFALAEERFDRALAAAAPGSDIQKLALVGRARARLDQGDASAGEGLAAVETSWSYELSSNDVAGRYYNRVAAQNITSNVVSVPVHYQNLTVQGQPDPRVPAVAAGTNAGDGQTPLWRQQKFTALTDDMPLATGVEARLIEAEVQGGAAGAAIVDAVRARAGVALPPLTAEERADFQNTLLEERRRELWLQGTRWYDLRRSGLPLVPATGAPYLKGGTYGDQRCWPLPDVERLANPNVPDQG